MAEDNGKRAGRPGTGTLGGLPGKLRGSDGGGVDPDQNFSLSGTRVWDILINQGFRTAKSRQAHGFHVQFSPNLLMIIGCRA
jgi:hypothetical protein